MKKDCDECQLIEAKILTTKTPELYYARIRSENALRELEDVFAEKHEPEGAPDGKKCRIEK